MLLLRAEVIFMYQYLLSNFFKVHFLYTNPFRSSIYLGVFNAESQQSVVVKRGWF